MKIMERNKQTFWFCQFLGTAPIEDEDGYETGTQTLYSEAESFRANVSAASGAVQLQQFGNFTEYDKVIVTGDTTCPIGEETVLFLDKEPEYDEDGKPLYDYIVKRVARSLNAVSIAVAKVSVS